LNTKNCKAFALGIIAVCLFAPFFLSTIVKAQTDSYVLTVNVVGDGCSVVANPAQSTYNFNDTVQLTPVAAEGWNFTGWSGDLNGTANPVTITMDANKTITATFNQTIQPTPTPIPTSSSTPSPQPTVLPSSEPTVVLAKAQASLGQYLAVIAAVIVGVAVAIGLVKKRQKQRQATWNFKKKTLDKLNV
jgi:uncharacterized repeat protein (TIGR02543 family)